MRSERKKDTDKIKVTIIATRSEIGAAQRIDTTSEDRSGKIIINGTNAKMSRTIDVIAARMGFPTA